MAQKKKEAEMVAEAPSQKPVSKMATETIRVSAETAWLIDVLKAHYRCKSDHELISKKIDPVLKAMYEGIFGKPPVMPQGSNRRGRIRTCVMRIMSPPIGH